MSYLLFIDDFEIHRNIYRALKTFYLIPVYLNYQERRKLANVFILLLNSHETKIENIVKVFSKSIRKLDDEVNFDINGNIETI